MADAGAEADASAGGEAAAEVATSAGSGADASTRADAGAGPGAETGAGALRSRLEGEVGRRLVHASGAVVPLAYLALTRGVGVRIEWRWFQAFLLLGVAIMAVLETARLRLGVDLWIFQHLTREYEQEKLAGYALYVVSFAVVALAARPDVALAAMITLAIADPVGGVLGEDPVPVKRPTAIAGTFVVCLAICALLLPLAAAVAAATAAAVADGVFWEVRGYVIDDNLVIPIGAAAAAELVLHALGG